MRSDGFHQWGRSTSWTEGSAAGGLGIALMPEEICRMGFQSGELSRVLPDWLGPRVSLQVVYPSSKHLSPNVSAFRELLVSSLGSEPKT